MGLLAASTTPYGAGSALADLLVLAVVIGNVVAGWRTGLVRRIFTLIGVWLAVPAAYYAGNIGASIVGSANLVGDAWAFIIVFVLVCAVFETIGALYARHLARLTVVAFDRITGVVTGLLIGVFEVAVIFLVWLAVAAVPNAGGTNFPVDRGNAAGAINNSVIGSQVTKLGPTIAFVERPLAPVDAEPLGEHFATGSTTTK